MNSKATVMLVTAELWPLAKTGGLADMVYSIATSLRDGGFHVQIVIPGYRSIIASLGPLAKSRGKLTALGHEVTLLVEELRGMEIVVLRCDPLYDRPGNIYMKDFRTPWSDNAQRFGVLCHAAASIVNGSTPIASPDLLHLHDWHAGLTPAYIEPGVQVPIVQTVQNFMFQGRFDMRDAKGLGLENKPAVSEAAALFSGFSFLQVGLHLSDVVTTVSPSYIDELARRNRFNWYYIDEKNQEKLVCITNWPQIDVWNPSSDTTIPAPYDAESLDRREINKVALQKALGWQEEESPILCTLSRITKPKGFGFLFRQIDALLGRGCRIVIVGEGDRPLVNAAKYLEMANPGRVALMTPYTEANARLVLSGADALLMPSLTEPCGLSQQHAQMYGCVPLVSHVGGLIDTVTEGRTGFIFQPSDRESFFAAVDRLLSDRRSPVWRSVQRACMRVHGSPTARTAYAGLFRKLLRARPANGLARPGIMAGDKRRASPAEERLLTAGSRSR